jgi:hypothetical protein
MRRTFWRNWISSKAEFRAHVAPPRRSNIVL